MADLPKYFGHLDRISEAIRALSQQDVRAIDVIVQRLEQLRRIGVTRLESEFRGLLMNCSTSTDAISESALEQLSSISKWLTNAGETTNYMKCVVELRSASIMCVCVTHAFLPATVFVTLHGDQCGRTADGS